jgi:hypothetical protein
MLRGSVITNPGTNPSMLHNLSATYHILSPKIEDEMKYPGSKRNSAVVEKIVESEQHASQVSDQISSTAN